MSLELWSKNGWLRPHRTTPAQIAELFAIVDRDLGGCAHRKALRRLAVRHCLQRRPQALHDSPLRPRVSPGEKPRPLPHVASAAAGSRHRATG